MTNSSGGLTRCISIIRRRNKRLTVGFPHAFFAKWFEADIQDRFEAQLNMFLGAGYVVSYKDAEKPDRRTGVQVADVVKRIDFPFGQEFTFDTFLINKKNYFPIASAKEVAKQIRLRCSTRSSSAGRAARARPICYAPWPTKSAKKHDYSTVFMGSMDELNSLYTIRFKGDPFKARNYLFEYEFLFIDDFHKIRGYPHFQQELVNIFNHFYDNKNRWSWPAVKR